MYADYVVFAIAIVAGTVANFIAHKRKRISRATPGILVVGLISSFSGFLLALLIEQLIAITPLGLAAVISFSYAYLMADARAYERIA